ncbi:YraN family protein [bacterium]|nr:YraN family protein [bacterium]
MNDDRRKFGKWGEEMAFNFLQAKGFKIIKRNYRSRWGEIDIIAKDKEFLVFVEVRAKTKSIHGHPLETITLRKQNQVIRMAKEYIAFNGIPDSLPCRFDVIAILSQAHENTELVHLVDAFRP